MILVSCRFGCGAASCRFQSESQNLEVKEKQGASAVDSRMLRVLPTALEKSVAMAGRGWHPEAVGLASGWHGRLLLVGPEPSQCVSLQPGLVMLQTC